MPAVRVSQFGKDHWSLLAYVETLCVDGQQGLGHIDRRRMRCNSVTHPLLAAHHAPFLPSYGTRLAGFFDLPTRSDPAAASAAGVQKIDHDDWDCLDDLEAAGYVEIVSLVQGSVRLTAHGTRVAQALRSHKAEGKSFAQFRGLDAVSPLAV